MLKKKKKDHWLIKGLWNASLEMGKDALRTAEPWVDTVVGTIAEPPSSEKKKKRRRR